MKPGSQIKVAMLAPYSLGSPRGGILTHVDKLTEHLSSRDDIELNLVSFSDENREFKKGKLNIHLVRRIKLPATPFSLSIFQIGSLWSRTKAINPSIVHAMGSFTPYSTVAALFRKKYPTILTVHASVAEQWKFARGIDMLYSLFLDRLNERYVVSKISDIIAVSPHVEHYISGISNANVRVIPNGVEFEEIQNTKLSKSLDSPSILYIGNLRKIKGVDILLEAIPVVKSMIGDIHVYIAGIGPEENELRQMTGRLHITENVEFLGFIEGEEKYSYLQAVDIGVFPSRQESFGMGLLEAMASGKAVLASDVGGIPFVIEDGQTGLLFQCGNVAELAEKIVLLLQHKELRQKLGMAGQARAKSFAWEGIAERTVEYYREVIDGFQQKQSGIRK